MTLPEAIIETGGQIFPHTPETGLVAELVMTAEALNIFVEDPPYREPGSIYRRYENERVILSFPGNGLTDSEREFLALTRTFPSLARRRAITDRWPKTKVKTERNYELSPLVPELELAIQAWKSIPKRMSDKACDKIGDVSPSLPKMKRSGQQATKPSDAVAAMLHDALQVVDGEIKLSDTTRAAELVNTTIGYIVDQALDPAIDLHKTEEMLRLALDILSDPMEKTRQDETSNLISQRALKETTLATTIKNLYGAATTKDEKYINKEMTEPLELYILNRVFRGMDIIDNESGGTLSDIASNTVGIYRRAIVDDIHKIANNDKNSRVDTDLVTALMPAIETKYHLAALRHHRAKNRNAFESSRKKAMLLIKAATDFVSDQEGGAGPLAERLFQALRTPLAIRPLLASNAETEHKQLSKRYRDFDRAFKKIKDPTTRATALLTFLMDINPIAFRIGIDGSMHALNDALTDETRGVADLQIDRSPTLYTAMTGMPPSSDNGWTNGYSPLNWLTQGGTKERPNKLITWITQKLKLSPIRLLNSDHHLSKSSAIDNLALLGRVSHLEDPKALATLRASIADMYKTVIDTAGKAENTQESDSLTYLLMCGLADITLGKDVSQEGWTPDTVLYDKLTGLLVPMLVGRLKGDEAVKKSTLEMIAHVSPYWRLETKKALLDAVVDETLARSSDLLAKSTFKDLCYALALTSPESHPHWVVELGNPEVDPKLYDVAIAPAIAKLIAGYETRKASTLGHDDSLLAELAEMGKILGNNQESKPNADKVAAAKAVCLVPVILDVAGATAPTGEVKEARFHGIKVRVRKELLESLRIRIDTAIAPLQHKYTVTKTALAHAEEDVREAREQLFEALGGATNAAEAQRKVDEITKAYTENLRKAAGMTLDLIPTPKDGEDKSAITMAPEVERIAQLVERLTKAAGEAMPEGSAPSASLWASAVAGGTQSPMQTTADFLLALFQSKELKEYLGADHPEQIGLKRIVETLKHQTGKLREDASNLEIALYTLTQTLPVVSNSINGGEAKNAIIASGIYMDALNRVGVLKTKHTNARLELRSARLGHFSGDRDDSPETQDVIALVKDANVALTHLNMLPISFADALEEANETAAQESAQPLLTSGPIPLQEEQIPAPQAPQAASSGGIKLRSAVVSLIQQTLAPLGANYPRREEIETALKALTPKLATILDDGAAAELIRQTVEAITNPK